MGLNSVIFYNYQLITKTQLCRPNFTQKSFLLTSKGVVQTYNMLQQALTPSHQEICVTALAMKRQLHYFNFYKTINLKIERNSCVKQS